MAKEGDLIKAGISFYPIRSGQFGFILNAFGRMLFVRYARKLRKIKIHFHKRLPLLTDGCE